MTNIIRHQLIEQDLNRNNRPNREVRLENLIRSGQDVFNACNGINQEKSYSCGLYNKYTDFKCCYKVGKHCTYEIKFLRK